MALGAFRFLGRVAAAGSQLVTQRLSGIVTFSGGIGDHLRRSQGTSLLPKFSCSWLCGSRIATEFCAIPALATEDCSLSLSEQAQKHSGLGFLFQRVEFKRTLHSSNLSGGGSLQGAQEPLTLELWNRLGVGQQVLELKSLPVEQRWRLLEKLEASGQRLIIVHWNTALHDEAGSLSVEVLVARVKELWKKGYRPDVVTYGVLLHACRRQSRLDDAFNIFQDMLVYAVQPDQWIWIQLALLLKESYQSDKSARLIAPHGKGMHYLRVLHAELHACGVPIDVPIACALMRALTELCKEPKVRDEGIKLAKEIQTAIRNQGLQANDLLCGAFIECYTTKLDMSFAMEAVNEMESLGEQVGPKTYAALVGAYAFRGEFDAIPPLLQRAESEGIVFEGNSLGQLMRAFIRAGRNEEVAVLFREAEKGSVMTSNLVTHYIHNCSIRKDWQEILRVSAEYRELFTVDFMPRLPNKRYLVPILLSILARNPTEEGITITSQALDECKSGLATACSNLLRNSTDHTWEACFDVLIKYQAVDTIGAHDIIQELSRALWALGRRSDAVKLVAGARENNMFRRVLTESRNLVLLDVHSLRADTAKAFLLLALRRLLVNGGSEASKCKRLKVVTGQGRHGRRATDSDAEGRSMLLELQKELVECNFRLTDFKPLPGGGAFEILEGSIQRWTHLLLS